jgi:hypothetical protein
MLIAFQFANHGPIRLAQCEAVPRLMVVTGPNGAGKSSLLDRLGGASDEGLQFSNKTLRFYIPPLRGLLPRPLNVADLEQRNTSMTVMLSALSGSNVPRWVTAAQQHERNVARKDAFNALIGAGVKYGLADIELQRTMRTTRRLDAHRRTKAPFDAEELPDVYAPLKEAVAAIFAHLSFEGVAFSDGNPIRCLFKRSDRSTQADIELDWLSSGEKATVTLLAPLLEAEMWRLLDEIAPPDPPHQWPDAPHRSFDLAFLIDEPEQHLHPDLQGRLLRYLRRRLMDGREQYILGTHSQTIIDACRAGELFVMLDQGATPANQLVPVGTEYERLEVLQELGTGLTALTTGRPLLLVEGEARVSSAPADLEFVDLLAPRLAARFTILPAGGKFDVVKQLRRLRALVRDGRLRTLVLALLDHDRNPVTGEGVLTWPVCTIENLLVSSDEAVARASGAAGVPITAADARRHLDEIAQNLRGDEIRVRVEETIQLGTLRFRPQSIGDVSLAIERLQGEASSLQTRAAEEEPAVAQTVDAMLKDGSYRRRFRGKELVSRLYTALGIAARNVGYKDFSMCLAREASSETGVQDLIEKVRLEAEGMLKRGAKSLPQ